jgi:nanoRNase/pAp phosphatase (c-di-AMP/oligoRNAs hydrolase)
MQGELEVLRRARTIPESNPEVTVAAVVGALVAVAVAAAVVRRDTGTGHAFVDVLEECDHVTVLTHPNPDPDALAAGMAVAHLASTVGVAANIQYPGEIRHQENRAMRTVLDIDCEPVDHVSDLASESVVLVDHNEPRGFAGAGSVLPVAVVDHHPGEGEGEAFTDVRTDYGATASVVAEYYRDLDAEPVPSEDHESEVDGNVVVPTAVATALVYGILTDTHDLTTGAAAADFAAAGALYPGVDSTALNRIANPQVGAEVLEVKARAIAARRVEGPFAVSYIGELSNPDAIPQAADELAQLEGVTAVVVCGECDGTVHLSGRSRDDRVHMGRVLEVATAPFDGATAGGHPRMGGGRVPVAAVRSDAARSAFVERLFETLDGAEAV